jgi:glycosyltransferase involved in cell wall biosynthesis
MNTRNLARTIKRELLRRAAPEGTLRRALLRSGKNWFRRRLRPVLVSRRAQATARQAPVHDRDQLAEFFRQCGVLPPDWSIAQAERDVTGAARMILGMLVEQPDLRRRFPLALTQGPDGDYCRWLCTGGATHLGLSTRAVANVMEAFARRAGERVRLAYDHRFDLRADYPLGLMSAAQYSLAQWFLRGGKDDHGLTDEDVWWFLQESAEDPYAGVVDTYLRTPEWQERFPAGLTVFDYAPLLDWVRGRYGLPAEWPPRREPPSLFRPADELRLLHQAQPSLRRHFPQAFRDAGVTRKLAQRAVAALENTASAENWPARLDEDLAAGLSELPGVNVLAHFCYPSGLGQAAHSSVRALGYAGIRTACRDVPSDWKTDRPDRAKYLDLERFDTTLAVMAPEPGLPTCYQLAGIPLKPGVRRIAVWYWELEVIPPQWTEQAGHFDEIWAPTRFIGRAMRAAMPIPVVDMLPGLELGPVLPLPRQHFGLPDDRYLFLFLFDMCSIMERKNPLGLIRAFRHAFRPDDRAFLAIKVSRGTFAPDSLRQLQEEAHAAGAIVIDQVQSREDSYGLMNLCDCYVSLHRSEGFGLTMAEAMLMGKPVVATGYSGNCDFMTPQNSRLVDYQRVPITQNLPFYRKGCLWAEPSIEQAASWMRWAFDHRDEARELGAKAKVEVTERLSLQAAGERMAQRLHELRASPSERMPAAA